MSTTQSNPNPNSKNMFDENVKEVSGPVNAIRMEGMVHGVNKVIYLFLDWHENIHFQTECTNVFSKDLNKYLAENFYKLNGSKTTYDFFMEVRPTDIFPAPQKEMQFQTKKNIYLWQVIKLFSSAFSYDREKDKVRMSDYFKNVRLHYLDIRDYLKYHIMDIVESIFHTSLEFMRYGSISLEYLSNIINMLDNAKKNIDEIIAILKSNPKLKSDKKVAVIKPYTGFESQTIERLVVKMKTAYKHSDIKGKLIPYYDEYVNELDKLSQKISDAINTFTEYGDYIHANNGKLIKYETVNDYGFGVHPTNIRYMIVDIVNTCDIILSNTIKIFARITDIYFLRRFLDKKYITNAIVYSGAAHSESYVKILSAKFGFKITHVAYSPFQNLDILNKEILARSSKNEDITLLLNPPYLYQCSDITSFPENFL
ncbi:hypothetical protein QJ856_gp0178 [Tupanvirus deep ocean]|uniref:Uncharacterized protein n=2 Tax=Tupanvirus TaxID=2094720 RepID=A0AC62A9W8_9VIRU|nr:hypothetical protein QJ856_gp0178 [Tupanvirus deep ocean]QKU34550.1 hypothetical protein [Tupanvirus deep ocean]